MGADLDAYRSRCALIAGQLRSCALLLFLTRLGIALILGLPWSLGLDLEALILLLLSRDLRQGGPWSMRWVLFLCLIELLNLLVVVGVGVAVHQWGVTTIGGIPTSGVEAVVIGVLALFFAGWIAHVGWQVKGLLAAHPILPPGRVFRVILAGCVALVVVVGPMRLALLRHYLFAQTREARSQVVVVDAQPVWQRVIELGPEEQARLGAVVLIPVADATVPVDRRHVPEAIRIRGSTEDSLLLGVEGVTDPGDADAHRVEAGSAVWWDPLAEELTVLARDLTLADVIQDDFTDRLLADGLPSRLESSPSPSTKEDDAQATGDPDRPGADEQAASNGGDGGR